MNKNEKVNIIINSFLIKIISEQWEFLSEDKFFHLCQHVDYNKVPDRVIANNDYLHKIIPWERVDRMKIVRLIARNIDILKFINLSEYNYKIKEVIPLLRIHPNLFSLLEFDLNKINQDEAFSLLTIGEQKITEKVKVEDYDFSSKQIYEIVEPHNFSDEIMGRVDLSKLKDYHICEIIKNTGEKYFDLLDVDKLTARKWVEILEEVPFLFFRCNLKKFEQSDIFNSILLISMFPEENLDFLIKNRNYKDDISAFGWEKLLIAKPNDYVDECPMWKLNDVAWRNILTYHPELIVFKP